MASVINALSMDAASDKKVTDLTSEPRIVLEKTWVWNIRNETKKQL